MFSPLGLSLSMKSGDILTHRRSMTKVVDWDVKQNTMSLEVELLDLTSGFRNLSLTDNIYILGVFTGKPCSKPLECNVVYIPIITLSHVTSHEFK